MQYSGCSATAVVHREDAKILQWLQSCNEAAKVAAGKPSQLAAMRV